MFKKFISLFTISVMLSLRVLMAQPMPSSTKEKEPVSVTLVAENKAIHPGEPFWVGIKMDIKEGWDTYWVNPGESGFATKVVWHLPAGFHANELKWPSPSSFTNQGMTVYGYGESTMLLAEIVPPKTIKDANISLKADVSWLSCSHETCLPGESEITLNLPISSTVAVKDETSAPLFQKTRDEMPVQPSDKVSLAKESEKLVLNFATTSEIKEAEFIPEANNLIDYHTPQMLTKVQDHYLLQAKLTNPKTELPSHVKGVILIKDKNATMQKAIAIDLPLKAVQAHSKFWAALFFAFVGGIILNVMPCVLPVIALKIMSFVKMAGEDRISLLKHGGAYTGGVMISFWVLTAVMLILRFLGSGVGWGFQLQEPLFVAAMVGFLFLFALSLFGLFEIGTSLIALDGRAQAKSTLSNAFVNGIVATLVATPCTGPFLGSALGFALTLPVIGAFSIFTAMGLGMALPYIIFSLFPKLLRFLPKPGNWMGIFKQFVGFIMMAAVIWLLWVFASQTSLAVTFILMGALLVASIAAWVYGRWSTPLQSKKVRRLVMGISLMLIVFSGGAVAHSLKMPVAESATEMVAHQEGGWQSFSQEKLDQLRKSGKPVFVDFTAKWCLICQSNKLTLHSDDVMKAFQEKGITPMIADWTKKSPALTQVLETLGRSGVPVYVIYPADQTKPPIILPQTLSKAMVLEYLNKI